jgi:hypothetical protein
VPTNPLEYTFDGQETGYFCGPASVQIALRCRGIERSETELAKALGTTTFGTNSSADVVQALNQILGAGTYADRYIGATVTDAQVAQLRAELVAGIDAGFAMVANVVGTVRPLSGGSFAYNGGHYVAVTGYRAGGDEAYVADVVRPAQYWVTTKALAVWIAERGYSYYAVPVPVEGVDYAWSRPDPAGLYAAGKRFASRYLSYDRTGKNLTLAEAEQLAAAGIAVVANWEWRAGDAKAGYDAGRKYAAEAVRQAAACGMPAGRPIYFSVDYDPAGDYAPVSAYFQGIGSVLPLEQVGAYGGYDTIEHLLSTSLIRWAWQTYAWSGGRWHPGAHVQQYHNGIVLAGGDLDLNRAMVADFGQWTPGGQDMASDDELYIQHVMNYRLEAIVAMRDPIRFRPCSASRRSWSRTCWRRRSKPCRRATGTSTRRRSSPRSAGRANSPAPRCAMPSPTSARAARRRSAPTRMPRP